MKKPLAIFLVSLLSFIFFIPLMSCQHQDGGSGQFFESYSNDSVRYELFKRALSNESTAPNYVMVKIHDRQSGLSKEICTQAPFLKGALHQEFHISYDSVGERLVDSIARSHKERAFSFRNPTALHNIGFVEYPPIDSVLNFARRLDLTYYTKTFSNSRRIGSVCFAPGSRDDDQLLFAHALFQCGILLAQDCVAGNYVHFGDIFHPDTTEIQSSIFEPDSVHYMASK